MIAPQDTRISAIMEKSRTGSHLGKADFDKARLYLVFHCFLSFH